MKGGEEFTGREYIALYTVVKENPEQLSEVATKLGIDPQEIIAFMDDADRITCQRADKLPWDGKSVFHL